MARDLNKIPTIDELRIALEKCGCSIRPYDMVLLNNYLESLTTGDHGRDARIQALEYEIARLNAKIVACCGETPDEPYIANFALNVNNVVGNQTINISQATFNIVNADNVAPNSLRIIYLGDNTEIASGLGITSPQTFPSVSLNVTEGNSYSWRAIIEGFDGINYLSNIYTIQCTEAPVVVENTMFYGNTATPPQLFQDMPIEQIFALEGRTAREIAGTSNNEFVIHQTDSLHYLLIPEDIMDLIRAEYGTVLITTLWDSTTESGAYFTTNPGGAYNGVNYRVFFSYSPMGAFPDDIRITCKNK